MMVMFVFFMIILIDLIVLPEPLIKIKYIDKISLYLSIINGKYIIILKY